jgi:hypothetical protein
MGVRQVFNFEHHCGCPLFNFEQTTLVTKVDAYVCELTASALNERRHDGLVYRKRKYPPLPEAHKN